MKKNTQAYENNKYLILSGLRFLLQQSKLPLKLFNVTKNASSSISPKLII